MTDSSFPEMTFDNDHCFLCGIPLTSENRSEEHIFPKWLQHRFDLWDQTIQLLNGTYIPYRKLTVPCCSQCNSTYLGQLEKDIQEAVEEGFESFQALPEIRIYQWMAKMFYGILFREMSLLADRTDPQKGFITSPEFLKQLNTLHLSLQSVRCAMEFIDFKLWSIFIVRMHVYGDERDFDYRDSMEGLVFGIRLGEIGIVASLQDVGTEEQCFGQYYQQYLDVGLVPIQYDELMCYVIYHSFLMNRTPTFLTTVTQKEDFEPCGLIQFTMLPLLGLSYRPLFNEWIPEEYAYLLSYYWARYGLSINDIFHPPDGVLSFLKDEKGNFQRIDP